MANITRFDPFQEIDNLFKGFVMKPVLLGNEPDLQIKMDVTENDKEYTVRAEIPGVKKEDIRILVDGNEVSISAEVKQEKEEKNEKAVRRERYHGRVYRAFSLDSAVDETGASAKVTDGVLELKLPKKAGTVSKQIPVN